MRLAQRYADMWRGIAVKQPLVYGRPDQWSKSIKSALLVYSDFGSNVSINNAMEKACTKNGVAKNLRAISSTLIKEGLDFI